MKPILLALVLALPLSAAPTVKKPAPVRPTPTAPAFPKAQIESAVRNAVTAYLQDKARMTRAKGVGIKQISTQPMEGWPNQFRSSGTATVWLDGPSGYGNQQTRSFDAFTTLASNGTITVTEVMVN